MEWINIKEKQPKPNVKVLAYCLAKYQFDDEIYDLEIQVAYKEVTGEWYLDSKNLDEIIIITHWLPLPNDPR